MKTFFISDLHFGHKNCLTFDHRPFKDTEEHDEALISRWNSVVSKEDEVWILGDVSWRGPMATVDIIKRLNGTKRLCIGNHDSRLLKNKDFCSLFAEIVDYKELKYDNTHIILSHYPIPCFNRHYYGAFHLYGHVHNSFEWQMMKWFKYEMEELYDVPCNMINVGCMVSYMNYTPRTFEELLTLNSDLLRANNIKTV